MTAPTAATAIGKFNAAISPWPTFWIASVAVLSVSIDTTVLCAEFGGLADVHGRKHMFLIGAALLTPASLSLILNCQSLAAYLH